MGQILSLGFDEIMAFVHRDTLKRNVAVRRVARTKRRVRRAQHARRKLFARAEASLVYQMTPRRGRAWARRQS
jgi:hypothetical protein